MLAGLIRVAAQRGFRPGWVSHRFRDRFHRWPATPPVIEARIAAERKRHEAALNRGVVTLADADDMWEAVG